MSTVRRSSSPSRPALALLALFATLPPALRAVEVCDEDGICITTDDPALRTIFVDGVVAQTWPAPLGQIVVTRYVLQPGSRIDATGGLDHAYGYLIGGLEGEGSLRIVEGLTRFYQTGASWYVHDGSGFATFYANNTHTGGTEVVGGTLSFFDDASLGAGSLTLGGTGMLVVGYSGALRGFRVEGDSAWLTTSQHVDIVGSITGPGRLNLDTFTNAAGVITLSGANTHEGGTVLSEGFLSIASDSALGAAGTPLSLGAIATLIASAGFESSSRELTLAGPTSGVRVLADPLVWNGVVTGPGTLVKQGPGTLVLTQANTFTGGISLDAGAIEVATDAALGADGRGITIHDGGALRATAGFTSSARALNLASGTATFDVASAADTVVWTGGLTGPGAFAKTGPGTLALSGSATHTGHTIVSDGTLRTAAANVLSPGSALFLLGGSTLDLDGHDQTVGDLDSYNVATGAVESSTVNLGGATLTNLTRVINLWGGNLTGHGTVVKKGPAEMKWYAANSFTGALRVDAGKVSAQAANVFSPNAAVALAAGTTLQLNDHAQTIGGLSGPGAVALGSAALEIAQSGDSEYSGVISGTGSVSKSGDGVLALSGVNTHSGGTTLKGGTVSVASDSALGSASGGLAFDGGALETTAALESSRAIALAGPGAVRAGADTALAGVISGEGSLAKTGAAALTLSGDNTYSGGTTVSAGTLRAGHVRAFGSGAITTTGGTLDLAGLAVANAIANRGGTLAGLANYAGAQTIHGAASFSGAVGGSVAIVSGASLDTTGAVFAGPVEVEAGGLLSGTGTLGALTVAAGATLSPGNSPGLLTIGDGSILSGTTLIELGGLARGDDHDAIDVAGPADGLGSVTVGGTLEVVFRGGWTPSGEASFEIFRAGSIGGTFAQIDLPALAAGYEWSTARLLTDGYLDLIASAIPEPGASAALAGLALFGFAATRRRRRRSTG